MFLYFKSAFKKLEIFLFFSLFQKQHCLFLCFKSPFEKLKFYLFIFLFQINIFLVFSNHFDVLILKIIFKKIKKILF
jgi:hypothetical protein